MKNLSNLKSEVMRIEGNLEATIPSPLPWKSSPFVPNRTLHHGGSRRWQCRRRRSREQQCSHSRANRHVYSFPEWRYPDSDESMRLMLEKRCDNIPKLKQETSSPLIEIKRSRFSYEIISGESYDERIRIPQFYPTFLSLEFSQILIQKRTPMTENSPDLPRECWEHIFNLLDLDHPSQLSPLSLVSKQFLHITNRLLLSLKLSDPTLLPILPRLLHRFQCLKEINLSGFDGDLNPLLHRIAISGLNLQSLDISSRQTLPVNGLRVFSSKMMNLTSLNCCRVGFLQDTDLTLIAESFPMLQELDISYPEQGSSTGSSDWKPISDSGVLSLAVNVKSLRRINLSGNDFITDTSLLHLAKNCVLLTQVVIYECEFITHNGVAKLIRACGHLNSVSFCGVGKPMIYRLGFLSLGCPWKSSKALCVVDFSDTVVPDKLLCLVAEACFPMKKIVLSNCVGYSFAGVSFLVRHYPLLEYLDLERTFFLTDNDIFELSKSFGSITYINLSYCHRLTSVTLDTLVRNCRVLNVIIMVGTNAGAEALETDVVPNLGVKILNLSQNRLMGNGVIANYVSVFPNLEMLNLSDCVHITEDGIVEVLKRCSRIRHLEISRCGLIENLLIDFELPKLEVLCARGLIIDDDGLTIIGKRCPRLQKLDVSACMEVTAKGVKEVVAYCKEIREIKLRLCTKFSYDIIPWMLLSRPSLKTIVLPSASFRSLPTECQRKHIVHEGVLVCDD